MTQNPHASQAQNASPALKRGRPTKSEIRQHIINLIHTYGSCTGYTLSKIYGFHYAKCTQRVIYYHLQKGLTTGEFHVAQVTDETGDYSWGKSVQKIYYQLGKTAQPTKLEKVQKVLDILSANRENQDSSSAQ